MTKIIIADSQFDQVYDWITSKDVIDNKHVKSLENNVETFDFQTYGDQPFSQYLFKRNRIVIPDEDGKWIEFIISETVKYRDRYGSLLMDVYTDASYLDIKKSKVMDPVKTEALSAESHVRNALAGTEWEVGNISFNGVRTFNFDDHLNPYTYLKKIASEFDLELHFRVEVDYYRISGRYVDMVEKTGVWRGRTVEFGKDLLGIRRIEKTDQIVTALKGIGPEKEDGTRLEVFVEDKDALARWGRNGNHLIEVYEPQSTDQDMSLGRLTTLTENELQKRVNATVEYEAEIADLEHVPGMENKKIRFGDTIKIKDIKFHPPLYLEARVHTLERNIIDKSQKKVILGDYVEYTEDEIKAAWKSLQAQIRRKISMAEMLEATYSKFTIDQKDEVVFQEGKTFAEAVGIEVKDYASKTSNHAEKNAKNYTEEKSKQVLIDAKAYSVAKTVYDNQMVEIAGELADKAGVEYVQGQLIDKVNVGDVYTIEELNNRFLNYVGLTQYETDMQGVVLDLETQSTQIGQNEEAISLKADSSYVDAVAGTVEDHAAQFNVLAEQISSKVDATYVDSAIGNVEVGGRNLLKDSKKRVAEPRNSGEPRDNFNFEEFWLAGGKITQKNQEYTFSARIEKTHGDFNAVSILEYKPGGLDTIGIPIDSDGYIQTTFKAGGGRSVIAVYAGLSGSTRGNGMIIHEAKLEKGNKATDWTPAPEDTQAQLDEQANIVEQHTTEIIQNADVILDRATKTEVNEVEGRVTDAFGEIKTIAGEVRLKASQTDFDTLNDKVVTNQAQIDVMSGAIALKAESSELSALDDRVSSAEINIDGLESRIRLKADRVDLDAYVTANDLEIRGDLKFGGHLIGAKGTFLGEVITIHENPSVELLTTEIGNGMGTFKSKRYTDGTSDSITIKGRNIIHYSDDTSNLNSLNISSSNGINFETLRGNDATFHMDVVVHEQYMIRPQHHDFLNLINGWRSYGGGFQKARCTKNADGMVYLSGMIKDGHIGKVITTLPVGCRPRYVEVFTVASAGYSSSTIGIIYVYPDGRVTPLHGSTSWLSLSGIAFRGEN